MKPQHARYLTAAALSGALALACTRPGEERAKRDLQVGRASVERLAVTVSGGLAAVRAVSRERLVLWASAPSFEVELDALEAAPLALEIDNSVPSAELVALDSPGALVTALADESPTKKRFELSLPRGRSRFRLSAPDAADLDPFRFALLSDVQEAIDRVEDLFDRIDAEPGVAFLLGAGDLTEQGTVEELSRFQRELESLSVPYYTTLGNHELGTTPPPYQDYFGRASFQFSHRGVFFTLLDSGSATLDPLVYEWLDGWLASARSSVHVVAMHIPPLDPTGVRNGAFASRGEAAALVARFAEAGVDLALYGHVHSYYAFENAGIPSFISGGGGAIPERFDNVGRHFMLIDVDPRRGVTGTRMVQVDE